MRIKAKKSFCGVLTMAAGEERDYSNEAVMKDLLAAGYIETVKEKEQKTEALSKKERAASTQKDSDFNESE